MHKIPGSSYCDCGQLTRRVLDKSNGPVKVPIAQKNTIGSHAGGFTMLYPSHPALDGMCWRCVKPEEYFEPGKGVHALDIYQAPTKWDGR